MNSAIVFAASALLGVVAYAGTRGLKRLSRERDDVVRSAAGGVSVSFVLLDLFVELAQGSSSGSHAVVRAGPQPVHTVAVLLLVGTLGTFVVASWMARRADTRSSYVVAQAPYLGYLVLVGATLVEEAHDGVVPLLLIWIAMAIHLSVLEHGLGERFAGQHGVRGALTSAAALLGGTALWTFASPDAAVFNLILALVAGATLLIAFRDELPSPERARPGAVLAGAAVFAALQQLRWWL